MTALTFFAFLWPMLSHPFPFQLCILPPQFSSNHAQHHSLPHKRLLWVGAQSWSMSVHNPARHPRELVTHCVNWKDMPTRPLTPNFSFHCLDLCVQLHSHATRFSLSFPVDKMTTLIGDQFCRKDSCQEVHNFKFMAGNPDLM